MSTMALTRKRLRRIAVLEKRIKGRLRRMCKGARIFADNYQEARQDLVALAALRPWEAKRLPGWKEYAEEIFGAGERQLQREFAAARVEALLTEDATNGRISELPESVLRPLTARDFTDEERVSIWGQVLAKGAAILPTARSVAAAASDHRRQRHFDLLSPEEQRRVAKAEEDRQRRDADRAKARQGAERAEKAIEYFEEALRAYERGLSFVRRGGKKIVTIEDGTRRIMDHVRAAIEGTQNLHKELEELAQE